MSTVIAMPEVEIAAPDHTQLPDKDGVPVMNFQEAPQGRLLTDSLETKLSQLHPDGNYVIGQDTGIYWRFTDPPLRGCKAPDWFYVPGATPLPSGQRRRSYVLWHEGRRPRVVLEFASGDGSEERDRTPELGKLWVYEQGIVIPYYGIFIFETGELEMYHLSDGTYERMSPNERHRFVIPPLQVELGVWHGNFANKEDDWLRWWDLQGNMLLTGAERAEQEAAHAAEANAKAAEANAKAAEANAKAAEANAKAANATARAERLAAKLRELGQDANGD